MTYGGVVVLLKVPDRKGKLGDVVLGMTVSRAISRITVPTSES